MNKILKIDSSTTIIIIQIQTKNRLLLNKCNNNLVSKEEKTFLKGRDF